MTTAYFEAAANTPVYVHRIAGGSISAGEVMLLHNYGAT